MDPESGQFAELMTAASEDEASVIRATLAGDGIPSWLIPSKYALLGVWGTTGALPTTVRVRQADLDAARDVLNRTRQDSIDLDWDEVDVGEPQDAIAARIASDEGRTVSQWRRILSPSTAAIIIIFMGAVLTFPYGPLVLLMAATVNGARRWRKNRKRRTPPPSGF